MILIDVSVPYFGEVLDFEADENAPISDVISRMVELLCARHKAMRVGRPEDFFMFSGDGEILYFAKKSLRDYGIESGNRVLLL